MCSTHTGEVVDRPTRSLQSKDLDDTQVHTSGAIWCVIQGPPRFPNIGAHLLRHAKSSPFHEDGDGGGLWGNSEHVTWHIMCHISSVTDSSVELQAWGTSRRGCKGFQMSGGGHEVGGQKHRIVLWGA